MNARCDSDIFKLIKRCFDLTTRVKVTLSHGFAELPRVKGGPQLDSDVGEPPVSETLYQRFWKVNTQKKIPSLQHENIPIRSHFLSLFPTFFLILPKHTPLGFQSGSRSFSSRRADFIFWVGSD